MTKGYEMKKLMKLMIAVAVMAFAGGALAQSEYVKEVTPDIGAAALVYTNTIAVGGSDGYKTLDQIAVYNGSQVTASNLFQAVDSGGFYTFLGTNAVAARSGALLFPERTVAWGDVTATKHVVRNIRVITYLVATNGAAQADAFTIGAYTR